MQTAARGLAFSSSSACFSSNKVFTGLSSARLQSNLRGQGKSFSTSVPSGTFKPEKGKKISKQERHAMVESFVDKYKASNAGRFPTVTHVRQETGGSYYTIRQIVQEMECNDKLSSLNKGTVQLRKAKAMDQSSVAKEVSSISVGNEMLKSIVGNKDESSISLKLGIEVNTLQSPSGENVSCRTEISTNDPSHDAPSPKVAEHTGNHDVLETEEHHNDHLRSSEQRDSSTRTTNLWGNLRSLADGIISFWRKM